jgi:hypothetical protein
MTIYPKYIPTMHINIFDSKVPFTFKNDSYNIARHLEDASGLSS